MAIIYKIENKENHKVYIGQTKCSLEWRLNNSWCGHFHNAFIKQNNSYICSALRKHGKESFIYEVIEEKDNNLFKDKQELVDWLNEREIYWIAYYKSNCHDFGYNKTKGSQTGKPNYDYNYHSKRMTEYNKEFWSNETKRNNRRIKVSEQFKKQWLDNDYRKRVIASQKETLSKRTKDEWKAIAEKTYNTKLLNGSLKLTEERKEKIRQFMLGKPAIVKGRKYINNGHKSKLVKVEELESWLSQGWSIGRGKVQWRADEN